MISYESFRSANFVVATIGQPGSMTFVLFSKCHTSFGIFNSCKSFLTAVEKFYVGCLGVIICFQVLLSCLN